jgi:hypothetical protein
MPEENHLTLWQVDEARTDFTAIEEKLDFHQGATRAAAHPERAGKPHAAGNDHWGGACLVRIESLLR